MSDWKRKTQEVSFENLLPEMVAKINKHIEQYHLGPILSDAIMCIQTTSEKSKKGLFGKEEIVYTGAVIKPHWLVWGTTSGPKMQTVALSAFLNDIVVNDYTQTQFAKMIPDSGIQVTGKLTDRSENVNAFIGVDDGLAGTKFKKTVIKAVQGAKK